MAELVLRETGLLPHANAGALSSDELARIRPFSPSQGMMIESVAPRPRRTPWRARQGPRTPAGQRSRLPALSQIPFTTGILVGIGDTRADQLAGLEAIAASHAPSWPCAGGDRPELPARSCAPR